MKKIVQRKERIRIELFQIIGNLTCVTGKIWEIDVS